MIDETRLDSSEAIDALDTRGSLRALASAGAQVRRSLVTAAEAGIDKVAGGERPRSILVASLGGSAVVCDVLELLAEPGSPVPVTSRGVAPLPGWIGPLDLVIAVSQSGRAGGPLALAAEAARRGAALLTVGAANSPLADICARGRGIHVDIDKAVPSSRTALWSMLTPVLVAADALGVIRCPAAVLERVADVLDDKADDCRPTSESFVNPAKMLAIGLADTVPVILGDGALTGVAAARAAAMLARSARIPTTHGALPDAAAQIVACFDGPFAAGRQGTQVLGGDIFADRFLDGPPVPQLGLLVLRDSEASPETSQLTEAVIDSAREVGVRVMQESARGGEPLERLASLMALTDFTATYLAIGLGLDPAVSRHVRELRDRTS